MHQNTKICCRKSANPQVCINNISCINIFYRYLNIQHTIISSTSREAGRLYLIEKSFFLRIIIQKHVPRHRSFLRAPTQRGKDPLPPFKCLICFIISRSHSIDTRKHQLQFQSSTASIRYETIEFNRWL